MFGFSTAAVLLIALGIGYIVLCFSKKESQPLKIVGYITGFFIIITSIFFIFNSLFFSLRLQKNMQNMAAQSYSPAKRPAK